VENTLLLADPWRGFRGILSADKFIAICSLRNLKLKYVSNLVNDIISGTFLISAFKMEISSENLEICQ